MNYKSTFTLRVLQLFIISLPFIAFGITIGEDTLPLSFCLLFLLGWIILVKKQSITIDNTTKTLFIFFIILIISACYRLFILPDGAISYRGEIMYIKNLKQLTMFFLMILHFLILRSILKKYSLEFIQNIIKFFISVCFVISLYSIYQFFAFQYNLPFADILRISKSYSITRGVELSSWIGLPRARAFMPEPSFWGTFLLLPFSLVLPYAFEKRKFKYQLLLFIFLIAQFLTFSRSCWFGFLFVLTCFIFYKIVYEKKLIRAIKISFVILFLIFLLTAFIVPQKAVLFERLFTFTDSSAVERFEVQKLTFQMFLEYFVIGIGFGNTPFFLKHQVTHNWYLQLLLETGIIGFSIFMFFLFQIWNRLKRFEKKIKFSQNRNLKKLALGLKLVFISILFIWINLPGYNFSYIWFILALITVLQIPGQNREFVK
jgi:O-antigen ligase